MHLPALSAGEEILLSQTTRFSCWQYISLQRNTSSRTEAPTTLSASSPTSRRRSGGLHFRVPGFAHARLRRCPRPRLKTATIAFQPSCANFHKPLESPHEKAFDSFVADLFSLQPTHRPSRRRKLWYTAAVPVFVLQLRPKLLCSTLLLQRLSMPTELRAWLLSSRVLLRRLLSPKVLALLSARLVRLQMVGPVSAGLVWLLTPLFHHNE